ncbi:MAG: hypothetical protein CO108_05855 [Deltaproteobacteria bacterium CG_4_9_14_3_um_filter_63_12]|nr:MAG: hypothetical protein CO108_05855 [Deltaproteobacteria bacterium CG_4_9_14_3_um_filter_63_12]
MFGRPHHSGQVFDIADLVPASLGGEPTCLLWEHPAHIRRQRRRAGVEIQGAEVELEVLAQRIRGLIAVVGVLG